LKLRYRLEAVDEPRVKVDILNSLEVLHDIFRYSRMERKSGDCVVEVADLYWS
jgi:hypothetical protein